MCEIKFENENKVEFDVIINTNGKDIMKGGVYGFYLDDKVLLYIGQTFHFLSRLSQHLFELRRDASYFGIDELKNEHTINFKIIDDSIPYEFDNSDRENEKAKEKENKKARLLKEKDKILECKPILQYNENKKIKHRTTDALITDSCLRNKIVKDIIEK